MRFDDGHPHLDSHAETAEECTYVHGASETIGVGFSPLSALDALLDDAYPLLSRLCDEVSALALKLQLHPQSITQSDIAVVGAASQSYVNQVEHMAKRATVWLDSKTKDVELVVEARSLLQQSIWTSEIHNALLDAVQGIARGDFPIIIDEFLEAAASTADAFFGRGSELASNVRNLFTCGA